tara:strand:+ start:419 stop:988 length:570 start_codon:yes stop_codon:yes gene_type:complete
LDELSGNLQIHREASRNYWGVVEVTWFSIVKIAEVEQVGTELLMYVRRLADFFDDLLQLHFVMRDMVREIEREQPELLEEVRRDLGNVGDADIDLAIQMTRNMLEGTMDKMRDIRAIVNAGEQISVDALYYELTQNRWQEMREWLEQIPREMLMAMDRQQLPDMPDIERMMEIVDMFREPEGDWTQMTD